MGVLKQLVEVNLYFNHLVGTIPPELGELFENIYVYVYVYVYVYMCVFIHICI